jgi:hypothetical protein
MASVIERALGEKFAMLHPKLQWRFGFDSDAQMVLRGEGLIEELSHSIALPLPAMRLLGSRRVLPARTGFDVPFTIENYAYVDALGRETWALLRNLQYPKGRVGEMDSTTVGSQDGNGVVDYLGSAPDLVLRTSCWVDGEGALRMSSGPPRILVPFSPRLPALASAVTEAREWWNEAQQRHEVQVTVRNRVLGRLLYYHAWFTASAEHCPPARIPARAYLRRLTAKE